MNPPININFDYSPSSSKVDGVLHLLKIYKGAPYDQSITIRNADSTYIRDFSSYQARMHLRTSQSAPLLLELTSEAGHLVCGATSFSITFPATVTEDLQLDMPSDGINETKFVFDIELLQGGVVVERFAQGVGFIVANTTRAA